MLRKTGGTSLPQRPQANCPLLIHEVLEGKFLLIQLRWSCSVPCDVEFSRTCADSKDLLAPPESSGTPFQFSRLLKALASPSGVCFFFFKVRLLAFCCPKSRSNALFKALGKFGPSAKTA